MGILALLKRTAHWVGEKLRDGVATLVDCTLEVCQDLAEVTATVCERAREKIRRWMPRVQPDEVVIHPDVETANRPLIEPVLRMIKQHFPSGIQGTVENLTEEGRVKKISELVPMIATSMGLESSPDLEFYVPEDMEQMYRSCGAYNWVEHKLKLNLAMIVHDAPELYIEQVSTIVHELVHARQRLAVEDWINGKSVERYGYTEEYVQILADNFNNYITPDENPEAYSKQPVESETFWVESQIKSQIN